MSREPEIIPSPTESPGTVWTCLGRELVPGPRCLVMGILNVTPDSFSDGGSYGSTDAAVARAVEMVEQGADIIDVGGESSRPGADPVSADEEAARVIPVIREVAKRSSAAISIDTTKAEVAAAALDAGAHIINDISGLTLDPAMPRVASETGAGVVVMHMQGTPRTMQDDPRYEDVVREVGDYLRDRIEALLGAGVAASCTVVDPGIGFGKTLDHNVALLRGLRSIEERTGRPVLAGVSRKRFIGTITGNEVDQRLAASLAAMAYAVMNGARIIRVHDVKESCDVARMMAKLMPVKDE